MPVPTRNPLRLAAVLAVALLATGCVTSYKADSATRDRGPDPEAFATTFTRIAPSGYIDMSLEIANPTDVPVTLRARLVALDDQGAEIPGVRVTSAFGSEEGRLVVMPGGDLDFVRVAGTRSREVRDVELRDLTVTEAPDPVAPEPVELEPLAKDGSVLEYDGFAHRVRLVNPNDVPTRIRVVLMVLGSPPPGQPQEASLVHDVVTVEVPASSTSAVRLDRETRRLLRLGQTSFVTLRPVQAP